MGWPKGVRFDLCKSDCQLEHWFAVSALLIDILVPQSQRPPIVMLGIIRKLRLYFFAVDDAFTLPGTLDTAPREIFCGRRRLFGMVN